MDKYKEFPYTAQTLDYLLEKSKSCHNQIAFDYLKDVQKGKITALNREHLIHWLSEICEEKGFSKKTMQLTISYIDLFLSKRPLPDASFMELITYTCLSLALKYEEMRHLSYTEIFRLCEEKFSLEVIQTTQLYTLTVLNWVLEIPAPGEILAYLMLATCEDFEWEGISKNAEGFILVARSDYELSRNSPAAIAVASALCVFEKWNLKEFASEWLYKLVLKFDLQADALKELAKGICDKVNSYKN